MPHTTNFHTTYPEPPINGRHWEGDFEHHATAIGYLCKATSQYEMWLRMILTALVPGPQELHYVLIDSTSATIAAKHQLVLKVASALKVPDLWFNELKQNFDFYTKEVAPKRNRLVHDLWVGSELGAEKWDTRTTLKKDGPRSSERISMNAPEP